MYIKANDDLIYVEKVIKCEAKPAPYKTTQLRIVYTTGLETIKEPVTVSEFVGVSKDSLQKIIEVVQANKEFVDISC